MGTERSIVDIRRTLHQYPEPGWCEFRSASIIRDALLSHGWHVMAGPEVVASGARMGVPKPEALDAWFERAVCNGMDAVAGGVFAGGHTGVVGIKKGRGPGPTIAIRFDMDANHGTETGSTACKSVRDGYVSRNDGVHHNCGHDGHVAIGLALARSLANWADDHGGEVRLIFQPAEEGLRGARAMVEAGVVRGVDYLLGAHIGVQALRTGQIICGYTNLLASTKIDAQYFGKAAHAALSPHVGRNALLAACMATVNLHGLPRHGSAETRVNVGVLSGGEARNTVPGYARLAAELRAETSEALADLFDAAGRVLEGAAVMHGVTHAFDVVGEAPAADSDEALTTLVARCASRIAGVTEICAAVPFKACDDISTMMRAVQAQGGQAVYFGIGADLQDVHHGTAFDFDEAALAIGEGLFLELARSLSEPLGRV